MLEFYRRGVKCENTIYIAYWLQYLLIDPFKVYYRLPLLSMSTTSPAYYHRSHISIAIALIMQLTYIHHRLGALLTAYTSAICTACVSIKRDL